MRVKGVLVLVLFVFSPCFSKKTKPKHSKNGGKRQVIVLPSKSHNSRHNSEVFVYGRNGGSGQSEEEQIDKETMSTMSNNILAATNLMRSQTEVVESLGKELTAVQTMVKNQSWKIDSKNTAHNQELEQLKTATRNATDVVSTLAVLWSKAEKKYLSIVKGLQKKVHSLDAKLADVEGKWAKTLANLENDVKKARGSIDYISKTASKSNSQWPDGNYCILANYACPQGFRRQQSFVKAVYMYATNDKFVKGGRIGSSYIGCYGNKCGQYGNYGVVNIVACCK